MVEGELGDAARELGGLSFGRVNCEIRGRGFLVIRASAHANDMPENFLYLGYTLFSLPYVLEILGRSCCCFFQRALILHTGLVNILPLSQQNSPLSTAQVPEFVDVCRDRPKPRGWMALGRF